MNTYKDSVYDKNFETHNAKRIDSPLDFELYIKTNALFWRNIIVSDSDLNNNPLFNKMRDSQKYKTLFNNLIKTGLIRRCARLSSNNTEPLSQIEVYRLFQSHSKKRSSLIDPLHPKELDSLFNKSEEQLPPLLWSEENVSKIFSERIIEELHRNHMTQERKDLSMKVIEYLLKLKNNNEFVYSSELEKLFFNDRENNLCMKKMWDSILNIYNGNIPLSLHPLPIKGNLRLEDGFLPSGSIEDPFEKKLIEAFYRSRNAKKHEFRFEGYIKPTYISEKGCFVLNTSKLLDLDIDEIINIRENSEYEKFSIARNNYLNKKEISENGFLQAKDEYLESLIKSGISSYDKRIEKIIANFMLNYTIEILEKDSIDKGVGVIAEGSIFILTQVIPNSLKMPIETIKLTFDLVDFGSSILKFGQTLQKKGEVFANIQNSSRELANNLHIPDYRIIEMVNHDFES